MTKDMTVGSPTKLLLSFSIPVILGSLFHQLYSVIDTIIVGRLLGVEALAGVGSTTSIWFLIVGFCQGVAGGFVVPVAQEFGAKNTKLMRQCMISAVYLCVIFSAILTSAAVYWCYDILLMLNTPSNIIQYAYDYIVIIFCGLPLQLFSLTLSGTIRSLGDSKTPVYISIFSTLVHIGLDFLLILIFDLGVKGAALATNISLALTCFVAYIVLAKKYNILKFERDDFKIRLPICGRLCYIGIPMGFQYSITAIGNIILQRAVNGLGSDAVAAIAAATKINGMTQCVIDGMGISISTYAGQNVGARKIDRVKKGVRSAVLISLAYSVVAFTIFALFFDYIILAFLKANETAIIALTKQYLLILVASYPLMCLLTNIRIAIQGMGFGFASIFSGALETVGRIGTVYLLIPAFGFTGACFSNAAAWAAADLYVVPMFFICTYILKKRFAKDDSLKQSLVS